MSQLAFNIHGERFDAPTDMVFWRVRRLKPGGRGTPEVVFDGDGLPLLISSEADIEEFKRLVRNQPGRYRLDAVNEEQRGCDDAVPAYLQLEGEPIEENAAPSSSKQDELLRMVVSANTEMARCIAEKFASVMDSAATLLRAADGAGMPQREANVIDVSEVRNAAAPPVAEVDDEPGEQLSIILRSALDQVMPLVGHTINTKVLGLSNEQSLALLGSGSASSVEPPEATDEKFSEDEDTNPHNALPPKDLVAHMFAIEKELEAAEISLVRKAVGQMKPDTLVAWREKLAALAPKEAAAVIRAQVGKGVPS